MNTTKISQPTILVDEHGNVQYPDVLLQKQTHTGIKVNAETKELSVDTGEIYGDIAIMVVIGTVIVLSFFFYGYFFGTRNVEQKVELARKIERENAEWYRR